MDRNNFLYKDKFMPSKLTLSRTSVRESSQSSNEYNSSQDIFFNNISHELRTPINVVLGSIQLFEMMGDDLFMQYNRSKFKLYNNIMKQNCYRLLRAVNNLIDVSKLDSGNLSLCIDNHDIIQTIKSIVSGVEPYAAGKGLTIKFTFKRKKIVVACDEDKLARVVLNLISNAIKFTPKGGKIDVLVKQKKNTLYISVKDTGIGIPADQLDNIFKRFVQVDKTLSRDHEGNGIGLSLAVSIVKLHEGKITAKSRLGKGSNFTVELPLKTIPKSDCHKKTGSELNLSPREMVKIELSDLL